MWSQSDLRFLRSLLIVAGEPAPPSPRFVVEPGMVDGEFHVVDRQRQFKDYVIGKGFKNRRGAAEDYARQMNAKHQAKQ